MSDETKTPDEIKTVGDLLKAAENDPGLLDRAHRKVWKVISSPINGEKPEILSELKAPREKNLFHDQPPQYMRFPLFKNELVGIDPCLAETGEFFRQAASGGAMERRILEITGKTGVGKTTWLKLIADKMEEESFFYLDECPHNEHPLNAVPRALRKKIKQPLDDIQRVLCHENIASRLSRFRGRLCRRCEERFQKEFGGKWENMPVKSSEYRLGAGIGMLQIEGRLTEPEFDKEGRVSKIPEDWYRIVDLANGGLLLIDFPAQNSEFCGRLSRMVSDGWFKGRDQTDLWPDIAVVSISNKTIRDVFPKEDALIDRVISVTFPMVMDPVAELKIQRKESMSEERSFHFVPWVEEAACQVITASRLEPDSYPYKLKLESPEAALFYGGGALISDDRKFLVKHSFRELCNKRPKDGTRGLTMRQGGNLMALAGQQNNCVGINQFIRTVREANFENMESDSLARIKKWVPIDKNSSGEYEHAPLEDRYQERAVEDLVRGHVGPSAFIERQEKYFNDYAVHMKALVKKQKVEIRNAEGKIEHIDPNKDFLEKIEEQIGVIGATIDDFRKCVDSNLPGDPPYDFDSHPPLKEAVTKKIISEYYVIVRRAICWNSLDPEKDKAVDPNKARQNLDKIRAELLKARYQPCCWENLLSYARRIFK